MVCSNPAIAERRSSRPTTAHAEGYPARIRASGNLAALACVQRRFSRRCMGSVRAGVRRGRRERDRPFPLPRISTARSRPDSLREDEGKGRARGLRVTAGSDRSHVGRRGVPLLLAAFDQPAPQGDSRRNPRAHETRTIRASDVYDPANIGDGSCDVTGRSDDSPRVPPVCGAWGRIRGGTGIRVRVPRCASSLSS